MKVSADIVLLGKKAKSCCGIFIKTSNPFTFSEVTAGLLPTLSLAIHIRMDTTDISQNCMQAIFVDANLTPLLLVSNQRGTLQTKSLDALLPIPYLPQYFSNCHYQSLILPVLLCHSSFCFTVFVLLLIEKEDTFIMGHLSKLNDWM